ncbi:kelch-like protein diablo [Caerostris extrusa]|uniref:Kelch-like protein diablo n=1 Tax=Caerostris extrusa TaxID=172846 RepID=A0AAV4RX84_CAEEX|nr:kelch-like protein diablo [Caerostris extrusa]
MSSAPKKSFPEIFNNGKWADQQKFCDGCLLTEDGTKFNVHRVLLCQCSEYFRALFCFGMRHEALIPGIESSTLDSILMYIYTGVAYLDTKNVWDMMIASDYLLMDGLMEKCRSFAVQHLTIRNCILSLNIAWPIDRLALFNDCFRYAVIHFQNIFSTWVEGIDDFPIEIFRKLLKSNSLNITSERFVWEAIVMWTEAKKSARLPYVSELVTYLRLEEEVDEELAQEILSHHLINVNPYCFLYLNKQFNYYLTKCTILNQHVKYANTFDQISPVGPRAPKYMHFVAHHFINSRKYGSALYVSYDDNLDFWRFVGEVHFFIDAVVRIGQFIYLFNTWDNVVFAFDIIEETWVPMASLFAPRYNYHVVVQGEEIFALGGDTDSHFSTTLVSRYVPRLNSWQSMNLAYSMVIYGSVVLNDLVYAVGLSELQQEEQHMMCQVYDPATDNWSLVAAPNVYRRSFSVVVYRDHIYAIAGENTEKIMSKRWKKKLIVYDNNHEDTRFYEVPPPVCWDEESQLWRVIDESSPLHSIERYTFCVLDDCRLVKDLTAKNRRPGTQWERRPSL